MDSIVSFLILAVLVGVPFLWCILASLKCKRAGCGHNEEDHVAGPDGDECIMCECKRFR